MIEEFRDQYGNLCHLVHRISKTETMRQDLISPENWLNCAFLNLSKGTTFRTHKHILHDVPNKAHAQESWVVIKGKVKATFMDSWWNILGEPILEAGDVSFTLTGGHTYTILDDAIVYEFKSGPYMGQKADKIFKKETDNDQ